MISKSPVKGKYDTMIDRDSASRCCRTRTQDADAPGGTAQGEPVPAAGGILGKVGDLFGSIFGTSRPRGQRSVDDPACRARSHPLGHQPGARQGRRRSSASRSAARWATPSAAPSCAARSAASCGGELVPHTLCAAMPSSGHGLVHPSSWACSSTRVERTTNAAECHCHRRALLDPGAARPAAGGADPRSRACQAARRHRRASASARWTRPASTCRCSRRPRRRCMSSIPTRRSRWRAAPTIICTSRSARIRPASPALPRCRCPIPRLPPTSSSAR